MLRAPLVSCWRWKNVRKVLQEWRERGTCNARRWLQIDVGLHIERGRSRMFIAGIGLVLAINFGLVINAGKAKEIMDQYNGKFSEPCHSSVSDFLMVHQLSQWKFFRWGMEQAALGSTAFRPNRFMDSCRSCARVRVFGRLHPKNMWGFTEGGL